MKKADVPARPDLVALLVTFAGGSGSVLRAYPIEPTSTGLMSDCSGAQHWTVRSSSSMRGLGAAGEAMVRRCG